jgi:hypothetical protein
MRYILLFWVDETGGVTARPARASAILTCTGAPVE